MDLSRPFYDSNIEALRVNADGTHDKVRLGELRVGDVVMTADARGGVRASRVTNAQTIRQRTKWFVADVAGYEQLNPTGTSGTYRTLADGIAVGVHSHVLNAHPMPVTKIFSDGAKIAGELEIVGGARKKIVTAEGLVHSQAYKWFICAGHFENEDYDKMEMYARVLRQAVRPLGPGYTVKVLRGGRNQVLVKFRDEQEVSIPIGPDSNHKLNGIDVRVEHGNGWKYLRRRQDVDDVLEIFAREHSAAATWRSVRDLLAERATVDAQQVVTVADVQADQSWQLKPFRLDVLLDRLIFERDGKSIPHAFMTVGDITKIGENVRLDADIDKWALGLWFGDGFAGRSEFSIGLPTDTTAVQVPTIGRMQRYIADRAFDRDNQTAEFVLLLQRLGKLCDAHDAEIVLMVDERETLGKKSMQVRLRRRGAFEGDPSVIRSILKRLRLASVYANKEINAEAFATFMKWDKVASLSFAAGVIDADGSGPKVSRSLLGISMAQSLRAGHKNIVIAFAFMTAQYGFDARLGLRIIEDQPPEYFATAEARREDNERRAQMTDAQRHQEYRSRHGIRLMTTMSTVIQGAQMSQLPLAVETKRDVDRDVAFRGISLLAFTCVDGGMRQTTFIDLDGAYNIVTAHGFALGVGNDFSPIKIDR